MVNIYTLIVCVSYMDILTCQPSNMATYLTGTVTYKFKF